MMYKILLFYKYISIENPEQLRQEQVALCTKLGLKGRILLGTEGINATLGGLPEQIDTYVHAMRQDARFADIDFKESYAQGTCFPKLKVKVRDEIVTLGIDADTLTPQSGGKHLNPHEVHELIAQKPDDLVILDARNAFEAKIGKFVDALVPDINHFRELPAFIDKHEDLFKNKKVLMYCTGGIRCERASAYLKKKNIACEIYQVSGGIHRYIEQYPNGFFRGKNYVFDGRIAVKVNDDVLSTCELCAKPCDDYTNCINATCNKHFVACSACRTNMNNTCSTSCKQRVAQQEVTIRSMPAKTAQSYDISKDSNDGR